MGSSANIPDKVNRSRRFDSIEFPLQWKFNCTSHLEWLEQKSEENRPFSKKEEEKSGHSEPIDILRGSHFCPIFFSHFCPFLYKKNFSLGLWYDDFTIDHVEIEPLSTIGRFFIP